MFFVTGKVRQTLDTLHIIEAAQRRIRAVQAVGCLLAPQVGDTVLLAESAEEQAYIIAVLARDAAKAAQINLPADTVIAAHNGSLLLCAHKQLTLDAPELFLQADKGIAEIRETQFTADTVSLSISRLRAVWSAVESRAGRVVQRVSRLYRRIGMEDSQLEEMHCTVEKTCAINAKEVRIEAEERLRLDGDRVELG
jgi:hypothetical protein